MSEQQPWDLSRAPRELFDAIEREQLVDTLAESACAFHGDWTGTPYAPPAAEQPGVYAWGEAHLQWAYTLQYEATGETRYLDTVVARFRRLLALRDDRRDAVDRLRGRVMPAWGSVRFSEGRYTCWLVHAGMLAYPAACFLHAVSQRPALQAQYAGEVAEFTAALRETIEAYEPHWHEGPGEGEGYYTEPFFDNGHLPTNQQNALGRTMLRLSAATGDDSLRARAGKLARFLKNRLVLRDDEYCWQYRPPVQPPFEATPAEDTSHAGANVAFMTLCHANGLVFDDDDMRRLARTFLRVVRHDVTHYADNIDGTGDDNLYADVLAYWADLAAVEPEILTAIRARFARRNPPLTGPLAFLTLAMLSRYTAG